MASSPPSGSGSLSRNLPTCVSPSPLWPQDPDSNPVRWEIGEWVKAGALDSMGCQGLVSWGESCRKEDKLAELSFSSPPRPLFLPSMGGQSGGWRVAGAGCPWNTSCFLCAVPSTISLGRVRCLLCSWLWVSTLQTLGPVLTWA